MRNGVMAKRMNIALILSGGSGSRLGSDIPKQYIRINDKMLITYSYEVLINCESIDALCLVADDAWKNALISELCLSRDSLVNSGNIYRSASYDKRVIFARPGSNRQLSVLNGLRDIKDYLVEGDSDSVVIIHDAARPNITEKFINFCIESLCGHDGVMPALPMKDTVYYSEDGTCVSGLLDRGKIYAGQAPEFYRLSKYLDACESLLPDKILQINGSTEPAVMARLDVVIVPGDENNYKITTREDLERFESGK